MWKDNIGQEVKEGDVVAYVGPGSYKNLTVGILLKVTPKGNASVCTDIYNIGTKDEHARISAGREYFIKIDGTNLESNKIQILNKIKTFYGYTGN